MRMLTVGRISRKKLFPEIRIRGLWLLQLGWEVGDMVEIFEDGKEIVLKLIHVDDSKQLKLPLCRVQPAGETPCGSAPYHTTESDETISL